METCFEVKNDDQVFSSCFSISLQMERMIIFLNNSTSKKITEIINEKGKRENKEVKEVEEKA